MKKMKRRDDKEPLTDDLIAVFIIGMFYVLIVLGYSIPLIGKLGYIAAVSWVFGIKKLGKLGKYLSPPSS